MNESVEQKALEHFSNGYVCSEAVLKTIAEKHGIDSPLIPAIASGFGSGLSRSDGGLCGAYSGGVMALSLLQGRTNASDPKDPLYHNVQLFKEHFEKAFGSCECAKLLGFSLSSPDAGEKFKEGNCKTCKCDLYVVYAVTEVEHMLTCKEKEPL
ncbi:C_GCAxxG_C_C family protein [Sulfurospirillum diekertiae]|uniref:C_GCAxxG_C_C family protein n=1 Tax=Sulfurospirillum diekertiae TaxID=1854492 RepID=A0A290HYB4_9BACT|nr:C-GCAxxG-C-C family protein [Sulfurospirillum diekertiae]ATB70856.1 C_GCAxxG_C_C family protein [Sulfurospirillum diekertiae]